MGYIILCTISVIICTIFLILFFVEKNKRSRAQLLFQEAKEIADKNKQAAKSLLAEKKRVDMQVVTLRARLNEMRDRLVQCEDPETIKKWLDETLKGEIL